MINVTPLLNDVQVPANHRIHVTLDIRVDKIQYSVQLIELPEVIDLNNLFEGDVVFLDYPLETMDGHRLPARDIQDAVNQLHTGKVGV